MKISLLLCFIDPEFGSFALVVFGGLWYKTIMKSTYVALVMFLSFALEAETLQKTLEKYSAASSIQFDIKKIEEKIIIGTRSQAEGVLKYQKNKIYISQNGDKKVEIFYADKVLSLVEHPDADFDSKGRRKVTVLKNSSSPLIKNLLSLFSNSQNFKKEFSTVSEKTEDGLLVIDLKPKQKDIKNLILKINPEDFNLVELSFIDDVETKITLQFSNLKLNKIMGKSQFQYKRLKTDEVITQ